ncbi:MAG: glycosyltransferase [Lachnospiraceae bacterium]|nr:glycosyltransferase [Lachnospiraceae bacterium]
MKVVLIDWNSYGNVSIERLFAKNEYLVKKTPFSERMSREEREKAASELRSLLQCFVPDYVFSFNYFPPVAEACNETGTPYISWIYDSPFFHLYSCTVPLPCNRIFVFDEGILVPFGGTVPTVHYLPLAPLLGELPQLPPLGSGADISFVGSLYSEKKHRIYDRFAEIPPFMKGYLDGLARAQRHVYGVNFLESFLTPEILEELQKIYPMDPNAANVMTPAQLYSQFVFSRQVTAIERQETMELLGRELEGYRLELYTNDASVRISGVDNKGALDYYDQMPQVFAASRINLNITLRSILTGIPLRAMDIMYCGGLLLSNYQEELCHYFVPGEDLVIYESPEDLLNKAEYLLSHEKERADIAASGCRKVREEHSLEKRLVQMEEYL